MSDSELQELEVYNEDNETVAPPPDIARATMDSEDDNASLLSASGLTMTTKQSQEIAFDKDDGEEFLRGEGTMTSPMQLEEMTLNSYDDMLALTGNTKGTRRINNDRPLKRPHQVMQDEKSMTSARTKTSKTSDNSSPSLDSSQMAVDAVIAKRTDHPTKNDTPRLNSNEERVNGASG